MKGFGERENLFFLIGLTGCRGFLTCQALVVGVRLYTRTHTHTYTHTHTQHSNFILIPSEVERKNDV